MLMLIMKNSVQLKESRESRIGTRHINNKDRLLKTLTKLKEFTKVKNNKSKNNT
jgi:hypothetical protein